MPITPTRYSLASQVIPSPSSQNKLDLKLLVHFSIDSLKYRSKGWRKSTVSLYISNFGLKGETHPQGGECILEMEQIYEIHELVKHFRKQSTSSANQSLPNPNPLKLLKAIRTKENAAFVWTKKPQRCCLVG